MTALHSLNPRRDKVIYNARVFNLSDSDELAQYVQVMRRYGDRLVSSPPERYFSSKSETVHTFVDWMSQLTFEEEFLGEPAPAGPPELPDEDGEFVAATQGHGGSSLDRLAARLASISGPRVALTPAAAVEGDELDTSDELADA